MSQPKVSRFMEKLLDGVEVEWKALGEVTAIKTGQSVNKQMISSNPGEYPVINSGREPLGYIGKWNTDNDPIGITTRGAGVGSVTWQEGKYFRGNLNYSVTIKDSPKLSTRYLYHLLLEMQKEIQALCTFDGIPALNARNLKELLIPIPCPDNPKKSLEIQAEIVRILDAFTAMTAELTAELNLRRQQYNYYRDLLLSEAELSKVGFEWKLLGEVSQYEQPTKYLVESTNYDDGYSTPVLTAGKTFILGYTDEDEGIYEASSDPVIIFDDFTTANKWVDFDFKAKSSAMKMITSADENGVLTKYIYYWLNTVPSGLVEGDHKRQWIQNYCNKKIPIPSLEEQARIVAILDKFDALTNSITEGLPREIELRQKQYEYYRDLLLSFPKSEAA